MPAGKGVDVLSTAGGHLAEHCSFHSLSCQPHTRQTVVDLLRMVLSAAVLWVCLLSSCALTVARHHCWARDAALHTRQAWGSSCQMWASPLESPPLAQASALSAVAQWRPGSSAGPLLRCWLAGTEAKQGAPAAAVCDLSCLIRTCRTAVFHEAN